MALIILRVVGEADIGEGIGRRSQIAEQSHHGGSKKRSDNGFHRRDWFEVCVCYLMSLYER